jgi:hypothetical protein
MNIDKSHKYLYNKSLSILVILITLLYGSQKSNANAHSALPVVIEVVYKGGQNTRDKLLGFCKRQTFIDANDVYEWNNHLVIYGKGYERFYPKFRSEFKDCEVKFYAHPFYDFERSRCSDKKIAKHWENIILTANLVADPKKQQEYLNYHKTQFEKWPEVSQGFCNASFQQLLVFKNGRQLMLIISIPKGESLDKLNPLTTKNNPRVDEWNKIMAKYQEGIEGTKPGETWVFLKPMK